MLFIQDYTKALELHRRVMSCWLHIKIHGISKTNEICNYCGEINCDNNKTKNHSYPFSQSTKLFFTKDIITDLLVGHPADLIAIYKSYKTSEIIY